ncbi:MAG: ABC transporter substrate-binding protein [Alphaproteobacteria bacterium]|nr:ABC transporter substrate-binding protein [Alphaproteobacteria bacterium]MBL0717913.1 ABC transporter substrate-binding protein [Alphaproteobacteria bacterium]
MMNTRILLTFIITTLFMFVSPLKSEGGGKTEIETFIHTSIMAPINELLKIKESSEYDYKKKQEKILRELFHQHLNMRYIVKFVLGQYAKKASTVELKEYEHLVRETNIKSILFNLQGSISYELVFVGIKDGNSKNQYFVLLDFIDTNSKESSKTIKSQWRVKYDTSKDKFQIIDTIFEGLSLVLNLKTEHQQVLNKARDDGEDPMESIILKLNQQLLRLEEGVKTDISIEKITVK